MKAISVMSTEQLNEVLELLQVGKMTKLSTHKEQVTVKQIPDNRQMANKKSIDDNFYEGPIAVEFQRLRRCAN